MRKGRKLHQAERTSYAKTLGSEVVHRDWKQTPVWPEQREKGLELEVMGTGVCAQTMQGLTGHLEGQVFTL